MQYINKAYLLIGGNEGNRVAYLHEAAERLGAKCGKLVSASSIFETAAWGFTNQPPFLNQALELHTSFEAAELMGHILGIEEQMGRKRTVKYGPRSIDIDILLFNEAVIATEQLSIPHPAMQSRRFALAPLAEIAGDRIHPVLQKTIAQLLLECPDDLPVNRITLPVEPAP